MQEFTFLDIQQSKYLTNQSTLYIGMQKLYKNPPTVLRLLHQEEILKAWLLRYKCYGKISDETHLY